MFNYCNNIPQQPPLLPQNIIFYFVSKCTCFFVTHKLPVARVNAYDGLLANVVFAIM